ncbi:5'-nucleotidase C-terminal domain-containing protein [Arenibacter latericius]|uniref:5'-nucleotidase C-terminal domain-containing protein n=1 Tax=Arenibacter latericius TaxID=86104 RepID=UPI001F0A1A32|nr:5'-nucleotidase [Arenibacter latericius]MDX1364503.1 5'-nucleotidase [Arenibacter latericius]
MCTIYACTQPQPKLKSIDGKQLEVNQSVKAKDSIETLVAPYRTRINEILDSVLAYTPKAITKTEGKYNTSAGNLMADIVLKEVNPIFKARTGNDIDFVLLNFGGIRSIISKGNITTRNAFEVMPFENSVFIAELDGKSIKELLSYLLKSSVPHPIAGIQIVVDKNKDLKEVNIKGEPFDENKTYFVATSDYLITGGDRMNFFKNHLSLMDTDYLIRNTMIDYFKKVDTIHATIDDRFIQID